MNTLLEKPFEPLPMKSLSWAVTKASLTAVVIGMGVYTAFEIAISGDLDLKELFIHHFLPTLLIGVIICGVLSFLLRSKVVTPIRDILDHLTRIGTGRLAPLERDSEIREIGAIVEGVNQLTTTLKDSPDSDGTSKAVDDLVKLRSDLKEVIDGEQLAPDHFVPIMKDLIELEGHLLSALQAERQQTPLLLTP